MRYLPQSFDPDQECDEALLSALSRKLKRLCEEKMLSQKAIEEATGVDQTTVSRAMNGRLKRMTDKVRRIDSYASMRDREMQLPDTIREAAVAFLSAGGHTNELLAFIRNATRLLVRRTYTDVR